MVAHSVSMESLRYLAVRRQVTDSIELAGIRPGTQEIAIVVFGIDSPEGILSSFGWLRDDAVLEAAGKSFKAFGISKAEAATVPVERRADLVLEKIALLDVLK